MSAPSPETPPATPHSQGPEGTTPAANERFPWRLFTFVFFGWTFDFYDLILLSFLKKPVSAEFGMSEHAEWWLLGIALGASGIGGIVAGWLADRHGKRNVMAATILTYSLGTLIAGLAPTMEVFFLGRAITGFGVGGEWAIGHGMLAEAVRPAVRGRAAAALQAGEPIGAALAGIVGFLLVPLVGWRAVMIGSSATGLFAFFVRRANDLPNIPNPFRPSWQALRRAKIGSRFLRGWILGVFKLGTYWSCYTWLPRFLQDEMKQGVGRSLAWVLTAQVGQFVGMLGFGVMSDRFGRRPAFMIYAFLTAAAIAPLAYGWEFLSDSPALFWADMLLLGFGSGCTAGFGALLAELYPTEVRSTAMGATYNLARSVQLLAPVLVGWAVTEGGLAGGLTVPLALAIATGLWVWTLPETRGIALPEMGAAGPAPGAEH